MRTHEKARWFGPVVPDAGVTEIPLSYPWKYGAGQSVGLDTVVDLTMVMGPLTARGLVASSFFGFLRPLVLFVFLVAISFLHSQLRLPPGALACYMQMTRQCPQREASESHILLNLTDTFLEDGGAGPGRAAKALNKSTNRLIIQHVD
jgi:hypothetical protein